MTPTMQTNFGIPTKLPDGAWDIPSDCGNCFSACIATILDLPIADVPTFCAVHGDYWASLQEWLLHRGLCLMEIEINDERHDLRPLPAGLNCILIGKSPRGDCHHAVVGRTVEHMTPDGKSHTYEYVHNPHPNPSGEFLADVRAVAFIVKVQ